MPAPRFAILTRARRRDPWELAALHNGPRDAAQRSAHATLAQERRLGNRTEVLVVTETEWDAGKVKGRRPLADAVAVSPTPNPQPRTPAVEVPPCLA